VGTYSFPILVRRISNTVGRKGVSVPGRRPGRGRRCVPIRLIGPTRNRLRQNGFRTMKDIGRVIGRRILSRLSVTGFCSGFGTNVAVLTESSGWMHP